MKFWHLILNKKLIFCQRNQTKHTQNVDRDLSSFFLLILVGGLFGLIIIKLDQQTMSEFDSH